MTFLSLFSGIGGLDLGLERAGMRCIGQVEIDPFCRRVLAKHWPDVPKWDDVRTFNAGMLDEKPDLICGGFPCQDISSIGKRSGIDGDRSGLWSEFARLIRELRPQFAFMENVSALLSRGLGKVLGDLAEIGYDAEWDCIPAASVGAPHIRDRAFIVGYANRVVCDRRTTARQQGQTRSSAGCCTVPDTDRIEHKNDSPENGRASAAKLLADANSIGRRERIFRLQPRESEFEGGGWWATEPAVGRMAYGVPARVDRLKGLGNAVVPQVAEFIGRLILQAASSPPSQPAKGATTC